MIELVLKKEIITSRILCRVFCVLAFIVLMSLGAFVRLPLPFTPVPLTLQTFFVLLSASLLGSTLGGLAQAGYIFLGVSGLPVFAEAGSGLSYLIGPTAGYLLGFVLATLWLGRFIKYAQNSLLSAFAILCAADLIILSCGSIWLKFIFNYSFPQIILLGFIPFIPGDLLKAFLAGIIYLKLKFRIQKVL
jgi:biotin transport system substrate-specific component